MDIVEKMKLINAAASLRHAADVLLYSGDQWECGEEVINTAMAVMMLRSKVAEVHEDLYADLNPARVRVKLVPCSE